MEQDVIECRRAGKVYQATERPKGPLGFLAGFFRKRVKEHVALRGIDLRVARGEMVGLIGANGAGKTTLVKCLTGIIPISEGSARLLGRDCFSLTRAEKSRLALVMGQRSQLWWDIPAIDSFRLLKEIYRIDGPTFEARVREQAERLGVVERLGVQLRQLSLGERMKMEIIGAFLHDPAVVFLDEPTIGLDLVSQEVIRSFLLDINRQRGATIVLTSHDMADIEETCQRLVILDAGSILFDGDLGKLQARLRSQRTIEVHLEPGTAGWSPDLAPLLERHGAVLVKQAPLALTFEVAAERTRPLIQQLFDVLSVRDLAVERQPLEQLVKQIFRSGEMHETLQAAVPERSTRAPREQDLGSAP